MKKFKLKDGTEVVLRPAKMSDLKAMNATFNQSVRERKYLARLTPSSLKESKAWLKGAIEKMKKRRGLIMVAYADKAYAGNANITFGEQREKHMGTFGVLIDKKFRGKGLGKLMMTELIGRAKKRKGIGFLTLKVYAPNKPAIALYKKLGFREAARLKKWVLDHDGKMIDEIIMRLDLK